MAHATIEALKENILNLAVEWHKVWDSRTSTQRDEIRGRSTLLAAVNKLRMTGIDVDCEDPDCECARLQAERERSMS